MTIAYVVVTLITAVSLFYAAYMNFTGHETVLEVAQRVRASAQLMVPFGVLQIAGAAGLLIGFAVPVLGAAAGLGVTLFFVCAIAAHLRVGDHAIAPPATFLSLAVASLALGLAEHGLV